MFKDEKNRSLMRGTVTHSMGTKYSALNLGIQGGQGQRESQLGMQLNPQTGLFDHPVNNKQNFLTGKSFEGSITKMADKRPSKMEFPDSNSNGSLLMKRASSSTARKSNNNPAELHDILTNTDTELRHTIKLL